MNKKLIILGTVLVLTLFVISACQGPIGAPLSTTNLRYIDPTNCPITISRNSDTIRCNTNQFIGEVTHITCPNYYNDKRLMVGSAWYGNTLPYEQMYTCVDSNGNYAPPSEIFGYCCNIQGNIIVEEQQLNRMSIDKDGIVTKNGELVQ